MAERSAITVVVGNPKPASRTRLVGEAVAVRAARAIGVEPSIDVIELSELGGQLFDWSSPVVRARVEQLAASRVAVIASPVYKASYTGLLKSFLDWFGQTGLQGVTAIPLMVGASQLHALAVEVHLRPVLIEIGATVPTRGVYVTEAEIEDLDPALDAWLDGAGPILARSA